ncbi:MAG TPA: sensor histidine kinase [Clostridia bacterium]|nr:sensor histidine kinase [Clostridia bacterium]
MNRVKVSWGYLSFRLTVLLVVGSLVALLGDLLSISPVMLVLGWIVFAFIGWFLVVRPYWRIERMLTLFLEGYPISDTEEVHDCAVSPANKRLFDQMRELLSPIQLFHMNKRQAQYLALQNQINPHFLYNTLESIRSETLLAGLTEVAEMTESLASFFRYTITKVENLVSVEEELQNCETYFSIQQYRFGDRLQLEIRCSSEERDEIYRCRLPKLTMQPILENSIIHGTELKVGTGHLIIYLERTEKRLLIRISDDGLGMDEETLTKINRRMGKGNFDIAWQEQEKGGLALVNVNNRIRLLFGEEYGLHVFSIPGVGTDVEITLPAIGSDREVQNSEVLS